MESNMYLALCRFYSQSHASVRIKTIWLHTRVWRQQINHTLTKKPNLAHSASIRIGGAIQIRILFEPTLINLCTLLLKNPCGLLVSLILISSSVPSNGNFELLWLSLLYLESGVIYSHKKLIYLYSHTEK